MLSRHTIEKLREMKLSGMVQALEEQDAGTECEKLSFDDRLGLLVDREKVYRDNRRLESRLRQAKLSQLACLEDVDYKAGRGLDRALLKSLGTCQWVRDHLHVLITGLTGVGKSFLAQALAHRACREGFTALKWRAMRLFQEIAMARGDGRYGRVLKSLSRVNVLVIDDWGLAMLGDSDRLDFLEILEERSGKGSLVMTSQLPVKNWHDTIGNPTIADAIMDRIVHQAYRIELKGETRRKGKVNLDSGGEMSERKA